jgi:fused signal recognition particle receptor
MSWFSRLKEGLKKTSNKISGNITSVITKKKLDQQMLEELEEILIMADVGVEAASEITTKLSKSKFDKDITIEQIKIELAKIIAEILKPVAKKLTPKHDKPFIILVTGVNGNGKTTTIGKLAAQYKDEKKSVTIAACDTFRAAAVEQLKIWAERSKSHFVCGELNSDPASVAFKSVEEATNNHSDILMIDTAGRLHNKSNLMDELKKINRVIKKHNEHYPQETILILDATTGQNAISQVENFKEAVNLTGLIITKLDGSAKAGIVIAIAKKFALPIYAVGVGEKIDDLNHFDPDEFAKNLIGA